MPAPRVASPSTPGPVASHPAVVPTSPNAALGVPTDADPSDDWIADNGVYLLDYNNVRHDPNWVAWRLTKEDLGDADRTNRFTADETLPDGFVRIEPSDYDHSGYDRGHMCPSAHRTSGVSVNLVTFIMTNMMPQVHALNAGPWKGMETYERKLAEEGKQLFIVAGGIFSDHPKTIGPGIQVPESNYRITVVLERGQGVADVTTATPVYAEIMPNDASARGHRWDEFKVSVDEIEARTGYDYLGAVDDGVEAVIEARR